MHARACVYASVCVIVSNCVYVYMYGCVCVLATSRGSMQRRSRMHVHLLSAQLNVTDCVDMCTVYALQIASRPPQRLQDRTAGA